MPYGQFGNCQSVLGPNCHGSKVSVHHILYSQSSLSSKACGYRLTQTLSQRPITFACLALPSLPIPAYVYHVSSGYANFELFENHWTMSPWDTCPHFCDSLSWLVQHGTHQFTEVCDRQTTTGAERHHTSRQQYAQVRPWTVTEFTCQLALARCSRSGPVQARCYSPPMSPLKAPQYLVDCCVAISDIASHSRLCSACHCLLTVPRHWHSTLGCQAFSVAGPAVLASSQLRDSYCTESTFWQSLKTFFFKQY